MVKDGTEESEKAMYTNTIFIEDEGIQLPILWLDDVFKWAVIGSIYMYWRKYSVKGKTSLKCVCTERLYIKNILLLAYSAKCQKINTYSSNYILHYLQFSILHLQFSRIWKMVPGIQRLQL